MLYMHANIFLSVLRIRYGYLLFAVREAIPDADGSAAAHGGPRRRAQLHLQRVQPHISQPHRTQAPSPFAYRSHISSILLEFLCLNVTHLCINWQPQEPHFWNESVILIWCFDVLCTSVKLNDYTCWDVIHPVECLNQDPGTVIVLAFFPCLSTHHLLDGGGWNEDSRLKWHVI